MTEKLKLDRSTLLLISGLSATGKTTAALAAEAYFKGEGIEVIRPVGNTTRDKREYETEGKDYFFWGYREFTKYMKPQIEESPNEYDSDIIGNNWYWSKYKDTIPSKGGLSILPVALSVCATMREKYQRKYPRIRVAIVSFRVNQNNLDPWTRKMKSERPNRDWRNEYVSQENHCHSCKCTCIEPDWNLETDTKRFLSVLSQIVLSKV